MFTTEQLATIAAVASAVATVPACLVSYFALRRERFASEADAFLKLRDRYHEITLQFSPEFEAGARLVRGTKDWQVVQRYWLQAFDEWFVTQRLNPQYRGLWNSFYRDALRSALGSEQFQEVLVDMFRRKISFGERREEFLTVLQGLGFKNLGGIPTDLR